MPQRDQKKARPRMRASGMLALLALPLAACGSAAHLAAKTRPPAPVNVTVSVNDAKISLSPSSVGAGPVVFIITNQGTSSVALTVRPAIGGGTLASTAPINPQATSSFSVDFHPGDYTLAPSSSSSDTFSSGSIAPASLHIGSTRANGNGPLLQP